MCLEKNSLLFYYLPIAIRIRTTNFKRLMFHPYPEEYTGLKQPSAIKSSEPNSLNNKHEKNFHILRSNSLVLVRAWTGWHVDLDQRKFTCGFRDDGCFFSLE